MTILYASTSGVEAGWVPHLERALPNDTIEVWPAITDRDAVEFLVVWDFDVNEIASFTNLQAVLVTGAGVSHLRPLDSIPGDDFLSQAGSAPPSTSTMSRCSPVGTSWQHFLRRATWL